MISIMGIITIAIRIAITYSSMEMEAKPNALRRKRNEQYFTYTEQKKQDFTIKMILRLI